MSEWTNAQQAELDARVLELEALGVPTLDAQEIAGIELGLSDGDLVDETPTS